MRVLVVLAGLIIPLVVYYPVNEDREKTIQNLDSQIMELDKKIEQAHAAERKLAQFHEEQERLNAEVIKLRRILPADPNLQEVREMADEAAAKSGVRIERFQPGPPIKGSYVEIPLDTEATGSAEALGSFFHIVRDKSRIINVTNITLYKADRNTWRAKSRMATFALPD